MVVDATGGKSMATDSMLSSWSGTPGSRLQGVFADS